MKFEPFNVKKVIFKYLKQLKKDGKSRVVYDGTTFEFKTEDTKFICDPSDNLRYALDVLSPECDTYCVRTFGCMQEDESHKNDRLLEFLENIEEDTENVYTLVINGNAFWYIDSERPCISISTNIFSEKIVEETMNLYFIGYLILKLLGKEGDIVITYNTVTVLDDSADTLEEIIDTDFDEGNYEIITPDFEYKYAYSNLVVLDQSKREFKVQKCQILLRVILLDYMPCTLFVGRLVQQ